MRSEFDASGTVPRAEPTTIQQEAESPAPAITCPCQPCKIPQAVDSLYRIADLMRVFMGVGSHERSEATADDVDSTSAVHSTLEFSAVGNGVTINVPPGWLTTISAITLEGCTGYIRLDHAAKGELKTQHFLSSGDGVSPTMVVKGSAMTSYPIPEKEEPTVLVFSFVCSKDIHKRDSLQLSEVEDICSVRVVPVNKPDDMRHVPDYQTFWIFSENPESIENQRVSGSSTNAVVVIHFAKGPPKPETTLFDPARQYYVERGNLVLDFNHSDMFYGHLFHGKSNQCWVIEHIASGQYTIRTPYRANTYIGLHANSSETVVTNIPFNWLVRRQSNGLYLFTVPGTTSGWAGLDNGRVQVNVNPQEFRVTLVT